MATGYDRIAEAFRLLATVEFPPHFLEKLELMAVKARAAHDRAVRNKQAADLLARLGPDAAATECNTCRASVYYRAEQHRKSKKPELV